MAAETQSHNALAYKPTSWYSNRMSNDTAQRILDSAQALIVERGYKGFSYADIAEVVKISKPSIHFHYPTKAVLAQQLVLRYREDALAKLWQLSAQVADAAVRLEIYADYWENCIRANTAPFCMCAMLASEMPVLPDEVRSEVQAFFRGMESWLASVLDDGVRRGAGSQVLLVAGARRHARSPRIRRRGVVQSGDGRRHRTPQSGRASAWGCRARACIVDTREYRAQRPWSDMAFYLSKQSTN